MSKQRLCPSTIGKTRNARIIGFIGPDGVVANIPTPIPVTDKIRRSLGSQLERTFRLAGPCAKSNCMNWENQQCGLIDRMRLETDRRDVPIESTGKLPRCGIRSACVWWQQSGPDACRVCPHVIYNPSS
jgi:hypothetical protein